MFEILTHKQQEEEIEKGCDREREREGAFSVPIFPTLSFRIIRIYAD